MRYEESGNGTRHEHRRERQHPQTAGTLAGAGFTLLLRTCHTIPQLRRHNPSATNPKPNEFINY
jgi:hypothetical protein